MKSSELLSKASNDLSLIVETVKAEFEGLSNDQLNWKPDKKSWSIIECIEHLNLVNKHYLEQFKKAIDKSDSVFTEFFESTRIGRKSIKSVKPTEDRKIKNKMKTFKKTTPSVSSLNPQSVLNRFLEDHARLKNIIEDAYNVNLNKVKVKSLLPILKFNIGDGLLFILAHEERHVLQAQNVFKKLPFFSE